MDELKKIDSMKLVNNSTGETYVVIPEPMIAEKINEMVDAINYILKKIDKQDSNHIVLPPRN